MGLFSRLPNSNDPPKAKSNWGAENPDLYDDFAALLNGDACRCATCRCVVIKKHQRPTKNGNLCPDCAEKSDWFETENAKVLAATKEWFDALTPEQRKDFIDEVTGGFCKHCYGPNPNCQCWNDE